MAGKDSRHNALSGLPLAALENNQRRCLVDPGCRGIQIFGYLLSHPRGKTNL